MKLAVVISGAKPGPRYGILNIALTRGEMLESKYGYDVDYYALSLETRDFSLKDFLAGEYGIGNTQCCGHNIHLLIKKEFKSDNRIVKFLIRVYYKLTKRRIRDWNWQDGLGKYLKGYEVITAHFDDAAIIARSAHRRYGTPFFVTWHGSDIHTIPYNSRAARLRTVQCLNDAECNFFVSAALMKASEPLATDIRKDVIYNAVDSVYTRYDEKRRAQLRKETGTEGFKVVAFAGRLRPIKNAELLPDIFYGVSQRFKGAVKFFIYGDGPLMERVEERVKEMGIDCTLMGAVETNKLADYYNITDVLVLPSKNEGLPLVIIEALSCGANVVGTKVAGIPEEIDTRYCVELDDNLVDNFAKVVTGLLEHPCVQPVDERFSWDYIARFEDGYYKKYAKRV